MNSSVLPVASEKRNTTSATPVRVKSASNSHNMPFAWCIQSNPTPVPAQQRQVIGQAQAGPQRGLRVRAVLGQSLPQAAE